MIKKRNLILFNNLASFILLVGLTATGTIMEFVLPPQRQARHGHGLKQDTIEALDRYFLGMTRHDWGEIHFYISVMFLLSLLLHLTLHWRWIYASFRPRAHDLS